MQTIAQYAVVAFGVVIAGACLWAFVVPKEAVHVANKLFDTAAGMRLAVGVRLVLGVLGWVERIPLLAMRCWLLFGLVFGGFLVFAAV